MDVTKQWLRRVKKQQLSEEDDKSHFRRAIGNDKPVKVVVSEMYRHFCPKPQMDGKKFVEVKIQNEIKKWNEWYGNSKLSSLLRFIRNFTQHAEENLSDEDFKLYFPKSYRNKQNFVQKIFDSVPTLLLYVWNEENNHVLGKPYQNQPFKLKFMEKFETSFEEYSEGNISHLLLNT